MTKPGEPSQNLVSNDGKNRSYDQSVCTNINKDTTPPKVVSQLLKYISLRPCFDSVCNLALDKPSIYGARESSNALSFSPDRACLLRILSHLVSEGAGSILPRNFTLWPAIAALTPASPALPPAWELDEILV